MLFQEGKTRGIFEIYNFLDGVRIFIELCPEGMFSIFIIVD